MRVSLTFDEAMALPPGEAYPHYNGKIIPPQPEKLAFQVSNYLVPFVYMRNRRNYNDHGSPGA